MCRIITSEVDDNMDEQNRVDDIDRVDGGSMSESNIDQGNIQFDENDQSGYSKAPYSEAPQMTQPGQVRQAAQQPQNIGQPSQSWQTAQQPQYGQPGQAGQAWQSAQQPQYGQPGQAGQAWQSAQQPQNGQPNQSWQPAQQPQNIGQPGQAWQSAQQPQYNGQPNQSWQAAQQPQYNGQPGQTWQQPAQQPQYGQPGQTWQASPQPQNIQPATPYGDSMGYMGYEYRQNMPEDMKKGSTHVPNLLNILGIIMAVVAVFLPYAHLDSDVRTISGVFGIDVLSIIIVAVLLIADIISAFVNKAAAYIIDLVISVVVGGAFIWEFILALMDLGKLDATAHAGLSFGAWFSVVTAFLLLISVPVWWTMSKKKAKEDEAI